MIDFIIKQRIVLLAIFTISLQSCDFFDVSESDYYSKQQIIDNIDRVRQLATQVYSYMPHDFANTSGAMQDAATDDAIHIYETNIQRFVNGTWSANYTVDDVFSKYYQAIHDANFYLENCVGLEFEEWSNSDGFEDSYKSYLNYEHEVRFLRAFYHFELVKRYKNIPIVKKTLTREEANTIEPSNVEQTLQFIIDECSETAKYLPANYNNMPGGSGNLQRITKGAALALKSRATLYLASPLYSEGNNKEKWKAAIDAANEIISNVNSLGYTLDSYSSLFGATNNRSNEVILSRATGQSTSFESANFPMGVEGGRTSTCPTENLVSSYEMTDGSIFDWSNKEHSENPYMNRDPRLGMTIVYNGMNWPSSNPVEIFEGGKNGLPLINATSTGYYLRKYVNNSITFESGQTTTSQHHNWIIFRYAEIILNYAEAMINTYDDPDYKGEYPLSAREAVNLVRSRSDVKMPDLAIGMSKENFLKRLKNERRIELAFEGHRFWDLRRWKDLNDMERIYKVVINKNSDQTISYTKQVHSNYNISDKLYFYPISNTELFKNLSLKQNTGWE